MLATFGGQTPTELEDRTRGVIDLLQFYGLQQRQTLSASNGALAENAGITMTPSPTNWIVLFGATMTITKTGTMTAAQLALAGRYAGDINQEFAFASQAMAPYGATETGAASLAWRAPFPLVLPPNTTILGRLQILGTDATAACVVGCDFGLFG